MINITRFAKTTGFVVILACIGNVVLTYLGRMLSMPPETFGPYMYSSVIGLTLGGVVAAAVVYYLVRRHIPDTVRANRYFLWLSWVVLIVSFYPDVAIQWSTDADQAGWSYGIIANLMLMHVLAGGLVMYYFVKPGRS
jgi:uncharacterized membrane protein